MLNKLLLLLAATMPAILPAAAVAQSDQGGNVTQNCFSPPRSDGNWQYFKNGCSQPAVIYYGRRPGNYSNATDVDAGATARIPVFNGNEELYWVACLKTIGGKRVYFDAATQGCRVQR